MFKRPLFQIFLLCALSALAAIPVALVVRHLVRPISLRITSHMGQQQFAAMSQQEKFDYLPTLLPLANNPHYSRSLDIALLAVKDPDPEVRDQGNIVLLEMIDQMSRIANSRGEALLIPRKQAHALNQVVLEAISSPEQNQFRIYFDAVAHTLTNPGTVFETHFRSQLGSTDRSVLLTAWGALACTNEDPYPQYLIDSLQEAMRQTENESIRTAALIAAGDLVDARLLGDITALLVDDTLTNKPAIRYIALRNLASYGSQASSVLPLLHGLQTEPDWQGEPLQQLAVAIHRIETDSPDQRRLKLTQDIRQSSKIQLW